MKFKFLLNIVFILFSSVIFSQTFKWDSTQNKVTKVRKIKVAKDSIYQTNANLIGFGLEYVYYLKNKYISATEYCRLNYKFPAFNIFYRHSLQRNRNYLYGFSILINYRKFEGVYVNNDKWIHSLESVNLEIYRLNLGLSFLGKFGKNKNLSFGPGIAVSGVCYTKGILNFSGGHSSAGYTGEQNINQFGWGDSFIASFNLETNYRIETSSKHYVVLGLKQCIESVDYFGYGKNFVSHFYLGYNF